MHGSPLKMIMFMLSLKKFKYIAVISLVLLSTRLEAQESSIFYKITGKELKTPSYLFGTIHMIPKDDFFLTKTMTEKFENADALVTEIPMDISLKDQMSLASRMMLPGGKTYADYMSEDNFTSFYTYLTDSMNIKDKKVDRYTRIKPVFLSGIIMKEMIGKIKIYEMEFHKRARKNDMKLLALESAKEQMDIVDSISLNLQFKGLEEPSTYLSDYEKLLNAYIKQDLPQLCRVLNEDTDFQQIETVMLSNRNRKWVHKLSKLIQNQSCFIAVGAAHLCGKNGLIELFENEGYTVKPLN